MNLKHFRTIPLFAAIALFAFIFNSCTKSDTSNKQQSHINIYLTDAPGDYQAVWIDIRQVMVKRSGDTSDNNWISVPLLRPGRYNLLDLRNGQDTILGGVSLPAGPVSQIRLILGDDNKLVLEDGSIVDLKTPSAQQSGLKLKVNANLIAGIPYELVMDFDAARSIVKAGNSGQYILKPVIRTFAKASGGAIEGVVLPPDANTHVWAIAGTDTLGAIPDSFGSYKFWGIPANNYTLIFVPNSATQYMPDTLRNVAVSVGNVTKVETVTLVH